MINIMLKGIDIHAEDDGLFLMNLSHDFILIAI